MFQQHNNGKHFHRFLQAEPKGQRECSKCKAKIKGAGATGRCSDLQTKGGSTKGTDEHCDYVFRRKLTKDKKKIQELEAQLAVCGGAVTQLQIENARLMAENAKLPTSPIRPSLSRGNSMISLGSTTSHGSLGDVGNFDIDEMIDTLNDPVSPTSHSSEDALREENAHLCRQLDSVRNQLTALLHNINADG